MLCRQSCREPFLFYMFYSGQGENEVNKYSVHAYLVSVKTLKTVLVQTFCDFLFESIFPDWRRGMRLMTAVASEKAHGCFYSLLISKWENKYNSINCINEEFILYTHQLLFSKFTSCRQSCQAPFFSTVVKAKK